MNGSTLNLDKLNQFKELVQGNPITIIGGGPSVKSFNFNSVDDEYVIAVNHAMDDCKQPKHALYYGDAYFEYKLKQSIIQHPSKFKFTKKVSSIANTIPNLSGNNSGTQALHLASQLNPSSIILVGFDMAIIDGQSHYHSKQINKRFSNPYERFKESFDKILQTITIPVIHYKI